MRARSASTQHLNPYRAGLQLGEALQDARPEVVFLFSSIHYRGDPLLLEGLHDGLASPDVLVAGCSGDGWYESAGVADVGASALALSSEGKVRWRLEAREGLGEDTVGVARGGCEALMAGGQEPTLTFLFAGRLADGSTLVDVVAGCLGGVVVGGLAGDDQRGGPHPGVRREAGAGGRAGTAVGCRTAGVRPPHGGGPAPPGGGRNRAAGCGDAVVRDWRRYGAGVHPGCHGQALVARGQGHHRVHAVTARPS